MSTTEFGTDSRKESGVLSNLNGFDELTIEAVIRLWWTAAFLLHLVGILLQIVLPIRANWRITKLKV